VLLLKLASAAPSIASPVRSRPAVVELKNPRPYVNKEIAIARDQAQRYRGSFLIPLEAGGLSPDQRIAELGSYQHLPLRESNFDDDIAALVSTLRRDYQRRQRERT
jgi:hypothetical protein